MSELTKLELYRCIRISLALTTAMAIWLIFNIDRGYWIPMTLIIIYAPFEPGLVNNRIHQRLAGTVLGLLFGLLIVKFFSIHPGLMMLTPFLLLIAIYFSIIHYFYAAIFITIGVMILFSIIPTGNLSAENFMIARLADTSVACGICFIAETLFRPLNMIRHSIYSSFDDIFDAYPKHLKHVLALAHHPAFMAVNFEAATRFNNTLLNLRQNIELNLTKLPAKEQQAIKTCLEKSFTLRMHISSIQYLITNHASQIKNYISNNKDNLTLLLDNFDALNRNQKTVNAITFETNDGIDGILSKNLNKIQQDIFEIYDAMRVIHA